MLKKILQKKFEKGVDKTDELCYNNQVAEREQCKTNN